MSIRTSKRPLEKNAKLLRCHSLAVESVGQTAVTRNTVAKVLDVESTLETARKETAEWRDQTCERGHDERVQLERCVGQRFDFVSDLFMRIRLISATKKGKEARRSGLPGRHRVPNSPHYR